MPTHPTLLPSALPGRAAARWLALAWCLARPAAAAPPGDATVYLDKQQALAAVFPEAERVLELRHLLTDAEAEAIGRLSRHELTQGGFYLYGAFRAGQPLGYAAIVSEVGKVKPITHIVGVTPAGEVASVAVMIYRESHGSGVVSPRFTGQFEGKTLDDPIRIGKDVLRVAGSTLSGHAVCRGVRKALAAVRIVVLQRSPGEQAALWRAGTEVTPQRAPDPDRAGVRDEQRGAGAARVAGPTGLVLERQVMGTACRVELYDDRPRPALLAAAEAALDEVARWDRVLSLYQPDSELSRLNLTPPGQAVLLSPELAGWLFDAASWARATGGAFDPAVGALVQAWGLETSRPARPGPETLRRARAASGLALLRMDESSRSVTRAVAGVLLDPGGSGKGFALDRAAAVLEQQGIEVALLSFRSTMLALDPPPGAQAWSVPIVHDGDGSVVATVDLRRGALSVSCGALRAFPDGAVERGHVLDAATAAPVAAGRLAWVVHRSAAAADALSTALLVRGETLRPVPDAAGAFLTGPGEASRPWPAATPDPVPAPR